MKPTVAIFGAGVGGLTAAHELVSRGYDVTIYEARSTVGGKARSQDVTLGGNVFPGEHGFRFFPSYYRHIPDSMERTPHTVGAGNTSKPFSNHAGKNVAAKLRGVPLSAMARDNRPIMNWTRRFPTSGRQFAEMLNFTFQGMGLSLADTWKLSERLLTFYTSCDRRRLAQFEPQTWAEYLDFPNLSDDAVKFMRAFPKCLVAMDALKGSAFTIGNTSFLLLMDQLRGADDTDRVLTGPTTTVWLEPWRDWLRRLGVVFQPNTPLIRFEFDNAARRIRRAFVGDGTVNVEADYYICALALDDAQPLITPAMQGACGECRKLASINLDSSLSWMVGVQFYLNNDVPVVAGHVFYPDSVWALTSVSQAQFWGQDFRSRYGHDVVSGIFSVDVSEWMNGDATVPAAIQCTKAEILDHLVAQINGSGRQVILEPGNLYGWHIDDDLQFGQDGKPAKNLSRLLIHPPGLLAKRPEAATSIANFFLASDYVKTNTDLATMESANEAGRRAANAIIGQEGLGVRCAIFNHLAIAEPDFIRAAKILDEQRFDAGFSPWMEEAAHDARTPEDLVRLQQNLVDTLIETKLLPP